MAGTMKSSNPKTTVVTVPTGNKKPNKPATVAKKATGKSGGTSTPPKGAIPMKKMGGMKSKKSC